MCPSSQLSLQHTSSLLQIIAVKSTVEELKSALSVSKLIVDVCRLTKRMETDATLRTGRFHKPNGRGHGFQLNLLCLFGENIVYLGLIFSGFPRKWTYTFQFQPRAGLGPMPAI